MDGVLDGNIIGYPNKINLVEAPSRQPVSRSDYRNNALDDRARAAGGRCAVRRRFRPSVLPGKHGTNYIYPAESYYKKYAE